MYFTYFIAILLIYETFCKQPQNRIFWNTIAFLLNHIYSGWVDVSGWHCCYGAFRDYTRNNVSKNLHFENDVRHGNRHYCACQTKENFHPEKKKTPQRTHTVRYSAKTTCACNQTSMEKIHICAWLQSLYVLLKTYFSDRNNEWPPNSESLPDMKYACHF